MPVPTPTEENSRPERLISHVPPTPRQVTSIAGFDFWAAGASSSGDIA